MHGTCGIAAKTTFHKVKEVPNRAARIITGATRSHSTGGLETSTRHAITRRQERDTALLIEVAKIKRLPNRVCLWTDFVDQTSESVQQPQVDGNC